MGDKQRLITLAQRKLNGMLRIERGLAGLVYIDDTPPRNSGVAEESEQIQPKNIVVFANDMNIIHRAEEIRGIIY